MLVGFDTSDDAGVYRLNDEQALVFTADFITPPVDDPLIYGQIAAANSLSDIYAMGGKPLSCLNLIGFPSGKLDNEVLEGIIAGALQKLTEAGGDVLCMIEILHDYDLISWDEIEERGLVKKDKLKQWSDLIE